MSEAWRRRLVITFLAAIGAGVFFTGINWGLPSRDADEFLFGQLPPWTGREIMELAGEREEGGRGADVPAHRFDRTSVQWINRTDAQRAEIVRRYRLYSAQPDEMLVLMSLRGMGPGKGYDPRMYQYGGLFIYPCGAIIRAAGALHLIRLTGIEFYLDHPEEFGRFYVACRGYVALWGMIGIWVVFRLARRMGAGLGTAVIAAIGYIFLPVVVNMTHEAKPHLPGAVLILIACLAASRFVESGKRRWMLAAGAACGGAVGMVLWGMWSFAILPVMACLRTRTWRERFRIVLASGAAGVIVYCLANPYVPINLVRNRAVVSSNLGNTSQMFHAGGWLNSVPRTARLIAEGTTLPVACVGAAAGVMAGIGALRRKRRLASSNPVGSALADAVPSSRKNASAKADPANPTAGERENAIPCLLAAPAAVMLVQFFAMANGKSAEYGRFAVLPDIVLLLAAVVATAQWCGPKLRAITFAVLLLGVIAGGVSYLATFVRDCGSRTTRALAADRIWQYQQGRATTVGVWAEPAPYCVPPVDLFRTQLLLLPPDYLIDDRHAPADLLVREVDVQQGKRSDAMYAWWSPPRSPLLPASMSWADKPFEVGVRKDTPATVRP